MRNNVHNLKSLFLNVVERHCNKSIIIKTIPISLLFILQPLLLFFNLSNQLFESIVGFGIIYILISTHLNRLFTLGFFIGIILFYWVSFSFYYFDMPYLIPFIIFGIGILYGFIFFALGWIAKYFACFFTSNNQIIETIIRGMLCIYYFDFVTLFGFNWFKPELFLSYSYFGVDKLHLATLLSAAILLMYIKDKLKILFIIPLILAISLEKPSSLPTIKIELANTYIPFEGKFNNDNIRTNFLLIDRAIQTGKDMIVLPETAFPFALNLSPQITTVLLEKSKKITILCGSIRIDEQKCMYNTNYLFKNSKMYTLDKVIGVPFGEVNPLPEFMSKIINRLFFNGAEDFKTAKNFSDFEVNGTKFRNAICYEATKSETYENAPDCIIALSNNAWFMPSLEPQIQQKLIKYYTRLHKKTLFHSVNMSQSYIIN